ncbi:MAG: hypothetical protein J7M26_07215 [Armatimonadetes bacterium]|nr:hypothetical protein [Armatimonadota bacterium]
MGKRDGRKPWAVVWLAALLAATSAAAWGQDAWLGDLRLDLSANPMRVPADGKTESRIRAEVRTFGGSPAPDGTRIVFNTDLGWLGVGEGDKRASVTVTTRGGSAIVFLRSDQAGVATVYAHIEETRTRVRVSFIEPSRFRAEAREAPARSVLVSGEWVGYCVDENVVEARGRSRIRYGGLVIDVGDRAVLFVDTMKVHALNVVVKHGDYEVDAAALVGDLLAGELMVQRLTNGVVLRQRLSAADLQPVETDEPIPPGTFSQPAPEGNTWFVADSVRVFPRERVVLRGGALYSGLQKVLSLPPYWIIAMPGYTGASNSSMLSLNSSGGLAVDLPFFFQVTDTWTGAVKLQRGTTAAGVSAQEGWTLALQEEYQAASGARGTMYVAGLPRRDWGLGIRDNRQMFGNFDVYTDLSSPDHDSVFFSTMAYASRRTHRFSLRMNYDKPTGYDSTYGATAEWLTYPKPFAGSDQVNYTLGLALGVTRGHESTGGKSWLFSQQLYEALEFRPHRLAGSWSLTPRLENITDFYSTGARTNSARAELAFAGRLGGSSDMRLVYAAEHASGDVYRPGWRQTLDLFTTVESGRWYAYLTGSRDLTNDSDLLTVSTDYMLSDKWRLGALYTHYSFPGDVFSDIELTLGRIFFGQEIGVRWSRETGKLSVNVSGLARSF